MTVGNCSQYTMVIGNSNEQTIALENCNVQTVCYCFNHIVPIGIHREHSVTVGNRYMYVHGATVGNRSHSNIPFLYVSKMEKKKKKKKKKKRD